MEFYQILNTTSNNEMTVYKCDEKCILYSGCLTELNDGILVMGGTVFSQVVLWNSQNSQVQQRITGHKGVIFSVFYSSEKNIIITTSDDRSVRIWSVNNETGDDSKTCNYWSNVKIESLATLFGHTARVMRGIIVDDLIVSIGEDGLMCTWRLNGDLIKKKKIHQGGCLWAMDSLSDKKIVVTGGSDSGVLIHRIEDSIPKIISLNNMPGKNVCKKVVLTACGNIVCLTEHGCVFYHDMKLNQWHLKHQITFSQSCHIMSSSLCRNFVSFAGVNGNLTIMAESESNLEVVSDTVIVGRILSLHWVDERCIVVCHENGCLTLWRYSDKILTQFEEYCLPSSKERWLTVAAINPSLKQILIVGDRCGNIHLFETGCKFPIQSLPKVHGRLGVNDIQYDKEYIMTTGRDGSVKYFHLCISNAQETPKLEYYHNIKVPFDWVEKFIDKNDQIVCGFHETNLVIWSMKKHTCILDINCSGGHRSWDLKRNTLTCNGEKLDTLQFTFIKNFNVHFLTENFQENDCRIIEEGFHDKEINDLLSVEYLTNNLMYSVIISAGEDTAIRISLSQRCGDEFSFCELYKITKHSSSIRCLSLHDIHTSSDSRVKESILFTGGGRAQICVWKLSITPVEKKPFVRLKEITNYMLKGTDLERKKNIAASYNVDMTGETRFMSLHCTSDKLRHSENNSAHVSCINFVLFAGCSDGVLRIYSLSYTDEISSSLKLIKSIKHRGKCILKVFSFVFEKKTILLSMAVDGILTFWDFEQMSSIDSEDVKPFHEIKIHKAGINSFDMILSNDKIIFATGGDDNRVCLNVFSILFDEKNDRLHVKNICEWHSSTVHCAQVTGVKLIEDYLITTSIDQRLTVLTWRYFKDTLECQLLGQYHSSISDVQGMNISSQNRNNFSVFIFGKGVEVVTLELAPESDLRLL